MGYEQDLFGGYNAYQPSLKDAYNQSHNPGVQGTEQQQINNSTWQGMQSGNTMYGRTVTGFQDEADRALGAADQRAAAFSKMGNTSLQRGQMLGSGAQEMAYQGQVGAAGQQQRSNDLQGRALNVGDQYGGMAANERAQAQSSLAQLRNFSQQGPGPSAAEAQMRQGADANAAQAIALAHSGRGSGANANAMRQAAFSNAAAGQQMNQQLGVLRANEAANWRGQQLQAMGAEQQGWQGLRGQDIGAQGQQLGYAQGMGAQGLGYGQLGLGYQQTGNQAQLGFEGMGAQNNLGFQTLGQNASQSGEDTRRGIFGTQLQADTSRYGADRGVQVGMREADQRDTATNYAMAGSLLAAMSDVRAKENIQPADMRSAMGGMQMGRRMGMYGGGSQYGQARPSQQMGMAGGGGMYGQQMAASGGGSALGQYGAAGGAPQAQQMAAQAGGNPYAASGGPAMGQQMAQMGNMASQGNPYGSSAGAGQAQRMAAVGGAPSQLGTQLGLAPGAAQQESYASANGSGQGQQLTQQMGMMMSDEREKERVMREAFSAGQQSAQGGTDLRPAQGYSYDYKNPEQHGAAPGRHFGPMAQDLEKTPAGASTVKTGPDGKKVVDASRLTLVNTAAVSELQRRTDELEALLNNRARNAPGEQLPGPTQPASNIGFHQSGATGLEAMQQGPYGLPDPDAQRRQAFGR